MGRRECCLLATLLVWGVANAGPTGWPSLGENLPARGGGEKDAALIVGIERYGYVTTVPGAVQNASDWLLWLTKSRGVPAGQVTFLQDNEGTVEKLRRHAAEAAAQVKPGGTLWVVFIGHGATAKDGSDGLLVGADAQQDADSLYARSLPQKELLGLVKAGAQARTLMILDTCFSGRTSRGQALVKGLQPLVLKQNQLATDDLGTTTILSAARGDQFAGALPGVERPAFSYLVLGGLRGWADENHDGKVTTDEAVRYAATALRLLAKDRTQTPEHFGQSQAIEVKEAQAGPDLATLAISLPRNVTVSELTFGGGIQVNRPKIEVQANKGLQVSQLNFVAEKALEAALDAQDDAKTNIEQKARSWCVLGEITDRNPYQAQAVGACRDWSRHLRSLTDLARLMGRDYQALGSYLSLRHKSREQKLAVIADFLSAYAALDTSRRLAAVATARDELMKGQATPLAPYAEEEAAVRAVKHYECTLAAVCAALCEAGVGPGCVRLAASHKAGMPVASDAAPALPFLEAACTGGDKGACADLGLLLAGGSDAERARAEPPLRGGCDAGRADACRGLGQLHASLQGPSAGGPQRPGIAEDGRPLALGPTSTSVPESVPHKAFVAFKAACSKGAQDSCALVAQLVARDQLAQQSRAVIRKKRLWGWLVAGGAVAFAALAGGLAGAGSSIASGIPGGSYTYTSQITDAAGKAASYRAAASAFGIISGAAAIAGATLLVLYWREPALAIGVGDIGSGQAGLFLRGRLP